jgi:hypothetical protein
MQRGERTSERKRKARQVKLGKVVENPRLVHSPLAILNTQLCNIAAALIDETTRTHPTTQPTK